MLALMGGSLMFFEDDPGGSAQSAKPESPQAQHGCSAYLRKRHALSTTQRASGLHLVKKRTNMLIVR
jgi:hypothetical protein